MFSEFKSSSSYLLAVNAICDSIVSLSSIITLILTIFGIDVTVEFCLWANAIPHIAFNTTFILSFLIALDRLIAVFSPLKYIFIYFLKFIYLIIF